jgi:hypothetical protein
LVAAPDERHLTGPTRPMKHGPPPFQNFSHGLGCGPLGNCLSTIAWPIIAVNTGRPPLELLLSRMTLAVTARLWEQTSGAAPAPLLGAAARTSHLNYRCPRSNSRAPQASRVDIIAGARYWRAGTGGQHITTGGLTHDHDHNPRAAGNKIALIMHLRLAAPGHHFQLCEQARCRPSSMHHVSARDNNLPTETIVAR